MKKVIFFLLFALVFCSVFGQSEPPRANFMSYLNRNDAAKNDYKSSIFYLPLEGKWSSTIAPLKMVSLTEYKIPQNVGQAQYQTRFNVPMNWLDRNVYLRLSGVAQAVTVFVNDKKVGYTEDSKSVAEFLLSPALTDGQNTLRIETKELAAGSMLENRTEPRATAEAYIFSQPKVHIEDYYVTQSLDESYTNGVFKLSMCLSNNFNLPSGAMQVWYELENADGVMIDYSYQEIDMQPDSRDTVTFERIIKKVNRWTTEKPYLYNLVLKIKQKGSFVEYTSQKIGFRTVEIKDKQLYFNGKATPVKALRYSTAKSVEQDLQQMKKQGYNLVYMEDSPAHRSFYEAADRTGIMVATRANIVSLGLEQDKRRGGSLSNNPQWNGVYMERTASLYHRLKNYPSIIFWSLGDNAGNGYNLYKTYNWLKMVDSGRGVIYHAATQADFNSDISLGEMPQFEPTKVAPQKPTPTKKKPTPTKKRR